MVERRLPRVDRTKFSVVNLHDPPDEPEFWRSKSHTERLEAIEISRMAVYGYDPATTRLHRVLEVIQLSQS